MCEHLHSGSIEQKSTQLREVKLRGYTLESMVPGLHQHELSFSLSGFLLGGDSVEASACSTALTTKLVWVLMSPFHVAESNSILVGLFFPSQSFRHSNVVQTFKSFNRFAPFKPFKSSSFNGSTTTTYSPWTCDRGGAIIYSLTALTARL